MTKDSGVWEDRHTGRKRERMGGGGDGSGSVSRQDPACLTKDIGEASLLCQDEWSHQWPSKSPVNSGRGRAHVHKRGQREGPVRTPQSTLEHNTRKTPTETPTHSFRHAHAAQSSCRTLNRRRLASLFCISKQADANIPKAVCFCLSNQNGKHKLCQQPGTGR